MILQSWKNFSVMHRTTRALACFTGSAAQALQQNERKIVIHSSLPPLSSTQAGVECALFGCNASTLPSLAKVTFVQFEWFEPNCRFSLNRSLLYSWCNPWYCLVLRRRGLDWQKAVQPSGESAFQRGATSINSHGHGTSARVVVECNNCCRWRFSCVWATSQRTTFWWFWSLRYSRKNTSTKQTNRWYGWKRERNTRTS